MKHRKSRERKIQIVRARALSISQKMASCKAGRTSTYSKDLCRVLQQYSVHRSPVDPEGGLVRRRDWALAVESLAEAVKLTSCGIAFNSES